jgi:hypothetical protein
MTMARAGRAVLVSVAVIAGAAAGAGTTLTSTWRAPDARPGSFQGKKVVAMFVSQEEGLRRGIEGSLAAELTRRGAQGVPAFTLVPTAEIRDEAKAKARITESGAAGLVALRLVGQDKEMTGSPAMYYSTPGYGSMWGGYWGMGWGGVYDPGYVRTENIFHVEVLVYSLEQNKLVWAGQSRTTNPKTADKLVKEVVGKVADEIKKAGLVQKGG